MKNVTGLLKTQLSQPSITSLINLNFNSSMPKLSRMNTKMLSSMDLDYPAKLTQMLKIAMKSNNEPKNVQKESIFKIPQRFSNSQVMVQTIHGYLPHEKYK